MKHYNLYILILIIFSIVGCNNNEKYLKLIEQENEIINLEIDRNYKIILKFTENNKVKYEPWKLKCKEIIELTQLENSNS